MIVQKQAEYLIRKFKLKKDLKKFGVTYLVGSTALKTMFKRDIDFQIYTKREPTVKQAEEIRKMLLKKGFRFVFVKKLIGCGKILIQTEYYINGQRWTIDITTTQKGKNPKLDSVLFLKELKSKLNNNKKEVIIKLKRYFFKMGLLHNGMSYYIYRAVIDYGAKSEKEVLKYLRKNKLKMSQFGEKHK